MERDVASTDSPLSTVSTPEFVDYQTDPSRYKHWRVAYDGPVATVTMDVNEDGGLRPGYKLTLNSYDLGVDIELHDIFQRIRFEHPDVRSVVITSARSLASGFAALPSMSWSSASSRSSEYWWQA